jgi:hypothetical protein
MVTLGSVASDQLWDHLTMRVDLEVLSLRRAFDDHECDCWNESDRGYVNSRVILAEAAVELEVESLSSFSDFHCSLVLLAPLQEEE